VPLLEILDLVLGLAGVSCSKAAHRLGDAARRRFWKSISGGWPAAQSTVLSGRVEESGGYYVVSAPYSFCAAGERYGGRYEREFTRESDAREALQRLLGSPPIVRYRARHPDTSVLDV
jgi:hypothetical protein